MSGAITPCRRAANAPLPPRWRWRPPRAMASTALTARAARVPRAISVSMLVAPCRSSRALSRRNGQPPAISTAMASSSTVQPAAAVSGAARATTRAAMARGHEIAARSVPVVGVAGRPGRSSASTGEARVADVGDRPAELRPGSDGPGS